MDRYVCIHGHFYQPPRENPWLEEVELQDSAAPLHDWNERITAECYGPNAAARLLNGQGKIIDIVNNYSQISFNMGPTLLYWMERHRPDVYAAILEADKLSQQRFSGHGSALAQAYNHMIMPLANKRDKYTQVCWGIRDFVHRFQRYPEGMWLPETAVDLETLEALAEQQIKFTILAPRQARRFKRIAKGARWHEARDGIDPTTAYTCHLPSGRSIVLFFYDGPISQDMAFGGLLNSGEHFANRLTGVFHDSRDWPQLVHVATDGESYGHHHRRGEMALSYCLYHLENTGAAKITNYGEFLELNPPTHVVDIHENSSWSCFHGIERWRSNCGCNSGRQGWHQSWRGPLREALDFLRDDVMPSFEEAAGILLKNPWQARNDYISFILDRSPEAGEAFFARNALFALSDAERTRALKLMELQRNCMLMYTSCGWFFDEISGLETTQVLQYAARAVQYAEELFEREFEPALVEKLRAAPSNVLENGAVVYKQYARPAEVDMLRVGAHYGISSLFTEYNPETTLYCYAIHSDHYRRAEAGKFRLAVGRVTIRSLLTWESAQVSFAVLHFGDLNVNGGVRIFGGKDPYATMQEEIVSAFERGHMTETLQLIAEHFGSNNYALWHLFRDEQRRVLYQILGNTLEDVETSFHRIYEDQYPAMSLMQDLRQPIPRALLVVAEYTVNAELRKMFANGEPDLTRLENLIQQIERWKFKVQHEELSYVAGQFVESRLQRLAVQPDDLALMEALNRSLALLNRIGLDIDRWKSQNLYFALTRSYYVPMKARADAEDEIAARWLQAFCELGDYLHVQVV